MTKVQGFECNVCEAFSTNRTGWLTIKPCGTVGPDEEMDVCSPDCLIKLGIERGGVVKRKSTTGRTSSLAGKPRTRYEDDFKLEVGLYALEHTDHETAKKFGVSYDSVRRWRETFKEEP